MRFWRIRVSRQAHELWMEADYKPKERLVKSALDESRRKSPET